MMTAPTLSGAAAMAAADAVVTDLIQAALRGEDRARITDAPAGAGKTGAVVRLLGALAQAGSRVGVVTQTNAQAFDLVARAAREHGRLKIGFMPASSIVLPPATAGLPNVVHLTPTSIGEAQVIVATADKWAYAREQVNTVGSLDAWIVDEAYQMTSAKLFRIAELFRSLDLVGDPGQLDPFSTVDDQPWLGLAQNPVLNAVDALRSFHPRTPSRTLLVSRRLDWRGTPPVRQAFYRDIAFGPAAELGSRELRIPRAEHVSPVWRQAAEAGWAYLELAERHTQQIDVELIKSIAELVAGLLSSRPMVFDERDQSGRELTEDRVAVGVSHRDQRAAISIALQRRGLGQVIVDTANRLQGREFDVLVAAHPLAGRSDASAFHLDAGRLCVLASRHRQCCVFVGRAGAARLLADCPPPGHTVLSIDRDSELDGWEAHSRFLEHLESVKVDEPSLR